MIEEKAREAADRYALKKAESTVIGKQIVYNSAFNSFLDGVEWYMKNQSINVHLAECNKRLEDKVTRLQIQIDQMKGEKK